MVEAVIFDLDGVIIDSETIYFEKYKDIIKTNTGKIITIQEYAENCCGRSLEQNVNYFKGNYGLDVSYEELKNQLIANDQKLIKKGYKLKDGVHEILSYLKENKIKIVLATSSKNDRAIKILESNEIDNYFDAVVGADDVKIAKPDPEIFLKASEKIGVSLEKCVVIEDSESGLKSSIAANIPVICIPDLKKPNQEYLNKALRTSESLIEVIEYFKTETENSHLILDEL